MIIGKAEIKSDLIVYSMLFSHSCLSVLYPGGASIGVQRQCGWWGVESATPLPHLQSEYYFSLSHLQHTQRACHQGTHYMTQVYISVSWLLAGINYWREPEPLMRHCTCVKWWCSSGCVCVCVRAVWRPAVWGGGGAVRRPVPKGAPVLQQSCGWEQESGLCHPLPHHEI